ncbi:MAG: DegQ family serine endoprotease [Hyphomicrobiaceae bacterium]
MKIFQKKRIAGFAALALFFTIGLAVMFAAQEAPTANEVIPAPAPVSTPVAESVVAPAEQLGRAFAAVAAHIKPAVVSVYSEKVVKMQLPAFPFPFGADLFRQFFGQQAPPGSQFREYQVPQSGMGSGMILDKQGHILTNYHVVSDVDEIKVQLADNRSFEAKIVGADPRTDVAVIQITGKVPDDLPVVQLGDSDALQAGNLVMAVGAPFGLVQTVTSGIVSAKGRSDVGITAYEDFLQTDAPINPGNSGGPLVNMHGEVIGMNTAIATGGSGRFAGVGFAIPSNMIKAMLPTLVKGGQISRGMLGVVIQDVTKDLAAQFKLPTAAGALVAQVSKGSPAEKAGLQAGDVIVGFNGKAVQDTHQLRNLVAASAPGTRVNLDVIRNGTKQMISVTLGQMAAETPAATATTPPGKAADRLAALGLSVQTLTPELAKQFKLEDQTGVLISAVQPGSLASAANLQAGDLIVEADRMPVRNIGDLHRALDAAANDRILLLIKRQDASLFVVFHLR